MRESFLGQRMTRWQAPLNPQDAQDAQIDARLQASSTKSRHPAKAANRGEESEHDDDAAAMVLERHPADAPRNLYDQARLWLLMGGRLGTIVLAALALSLGATLAATAHPIPADAAWDRQLHDCDDDWRGGSQHSTLNPWNGHDVVALDVREAIVPGHGWLVLLRLTLDRGFVPAPDGFSEAGELVTFNAGSHVVQVGFWTFDDVAYHTHGPIAPVHVGQGQPALLGGAPDGTRFHIEVGFTHGQLGAGNGDVLDGFFVQGEFVGDLFGRWRDEMPGGYTDPALDWLLAGNVPGHPERFACPTAGAPGDTTFVGDGYVVGRAA